MLNLGKSMFYIKVNESGVRNQEHHVSVNNEDLYSVVRKLYKDGFSDVFEETGETKGFVRVFLNSRIIENLVGVKLKDGDEVDIVSAFSGG